MQDYYLPGPGQFLLGLGTLGLVLILGLWLWIIAKDYYARLDKWLWKRRLAKWARQNRASREF